MKIICNCCNKKSKPKILERKLLGGIIEVYLKCSKCKQETRIALTNNEIRLLQEEKKKLINQEKNAEADLLQEKIKLKMDILNQKS